MFVFGLGIFALVYFGMGTISNSFGFIALFFGYGIYAAATEGISKAWISNLVAKENTATAIGTFSAFQSLTAMFASSIAGLIWFYYGSNLIFLISAIASVLIIIYFQSIKTPTAFKK